MKIKINWIEDSDTRSIGIIPEIMGLEELEVSVCKNRRTNKWSIYVSCENLIDSSYALWNDVYYDGTNSLDEAKIKTVEIINNKFQEYKKKICDIEGIE